MESSLHGKFYTYKVSSIYANNSRQKVIITSCTKQNWSAPGVSEPMLQLHAANIYHFQVFSYKKMEGF